MTGDKYAKTRPEDLANALQDRIHPSSGRLLAAKPIRTNAAPVLRRSLVAHTEDLRREAEGKQ